MPLPPFHYLIIIYIYSVGLIISHIFIIIILLPQGPAEPAAG